MKLRSLQIGAVAALCFLLASALPAADRTKGGFETGSTAPEISGKDLDGKPMKLSEFRGKVVVLDFWGFW
ncbi:MAG: redoxin domain-containing protein [Chloroflexi bacterium]|nr:redoxin domain-containing protein [Verrucomicrobiota bacterium]MBI5829968.1 redoxin domain-containing protein [Chloroflexota bacterium]